jgi:hypothetical protein
LLPGDLATVLLRLLEAVGAGVQAASSNALLHLLPDNTIFKWSKGNRRCAHRTSENINVFFLTEGIKVNLTNNAWVFYTSQRGAPS